MIQDYSSFHVVGRRVTTSGKTEMHYRTGNGTMTPDITRCARFYSFSGLNLEPGEEVIKVTTETRHETVFIQR